MDYVINFLSIVIIWCAIYYYINNSSQTFYESFQNEKNNVKEKKKESSVTEKPEKPEKTEEICKNNIDSCLSYKNCSDIISYESRSKKISLDKAFNMVKSNCKLKCGLCNDCKYWTYTNNIEYRTPLYAKNICQAICNKSKNCIGFHIKKINNIKNKCFIYSISSNNYIDEKLEPVDFEYKYWIYTKSGPNNYISHKGPIDFCQINSKKKVNVNKNTETDSKNNLFKPIPDNSLCSFKAWGPDKNSCINRCKVWSRTNETYKCSDSQCSNICEQCNNEEVCDWLKEKPEENKYYLDKPNNIRCIAGNRTILVNYIYKSDNLMYPDFFIIQYFKTRYPHEGIKLIKIKNTNNKINYNLTDLLNEMEYSIAVYPIIDNKENKNEMSKIINVIPQSYIKIYST